MRYIIITIMFALAGCTATVTNTDPVADRTEIGTPASGSLAQDNATATAESYLETMPFSEAGLIDQLVFEGYTKSDARFAVAHIEVDWNEQAAAMALSYLDTMPFSRSGLIDQLAFDGFTPQQATYGVDQAGL